MSIAITGPQKYDFQDIVCVEMLLRFAHIPDARFFVEPEDGEDAALYFTANMPDPSAEIQVKGAAGAVTLAKIATCLAHTPSRTERNTLLERLLADPQRLAVLVVSGRCDDASAPYTVHANSWTGGPHRAGLVTVAQTKALLDEFATAEIPGDDSSPLKAKRQAHNASFAKTADPSAVQAALRRLIIIERVDEPELEASCAERLRQSWRIPGDRIDEVIRRLRDEVKIAKGNSVDAFPLIRAVLQSAAPLSVRPLEYLDRGPEPALADELSRTCVLLLSGPPRVGKTWAARSIAAKFEPLGYEIRESSDVGQVERFLLEPTEAHRLAILNDPLGGTHPVPEPSRTLTRIGALTSQLRPFRKLIVAQGMAHLLATAHAATLSAVSTAGHAWHDLGTLPRPFLVELWRSLADRFSVPMPLRQFVSDALSDGSLTLEPGCLQHLASNHQRLGHQLTLDQVVRLSREDAADLGRALAEAGYKPLLSMLALTTTEQEPITFTELAFATGSGGDNLPSRPTRSGLRVTTSVAADALPADLAYNEVPHLTTDQSDALDQLEQLQLITVGTGEFVGFGHPFYRAASEAMLDGLTHRSAGAAATTVNRGLFCLSPMTSRATAKNLDWVFEKLAPRIEAQTALVDHAIDGLSSYFPATRDLCFRFLVRRLAELPAERQRELPKWISSVTSVNLYDLKWHNGQAYLSFPRASITLFDFIQSRSKRVERDEVATELELLNDSEGGYISPERAANTLIFFRVEPEALTLTAIGRLLSYDEAVLRAKAIELWLNQSRVDDESALVRIFADDHPSCALAAIKGAIAGWHTYTEPRRERILKGLSALATTAACAAAMIELLVLFNRVEVTGEDPPWPIFEALLPIIFQALPSNARFVDARLFSATRSAAKVLSNASVLAICDGWIGWLERKVVEGRLPSDYELGVGDILVSATRSNPSLRSGRIERLLTFPGTGANLVFVADFIDAWEDLAEGERTLLLAHLRARRSDNRWLQAAALTRNVVPAAVQQVLLGDDLSLSDDPDALMARLPPDLLHAAVHVYCGDPQPLWWLGKHHSNTSVWEPVVERIVRNPVHPLFEIAWEQIWHSGDGPRVANIIASVSPEHASRMLEVFIRLKVGEAGNYMPEAWSTLLALAPDDETHSGWIDRMATYAPAILDDLSDLWDWLTEERDRNAMANHLKPDFLAVQMTDIVDIRPSGGEYADKVQSQFVQLLELMIEKTPPQLFGTCDLLSNKLEKHKVDAPTLVTALRQRRETILTDRKRMEEALERPDPPLHGWVAP